MLPQHTLEKNQKNILIRKNIRLRPHENYKNRAQILPNRLQKDEEKEGHLNSTSESPRKLEKWGQNEAKSAQKWAQKIKLQTMRFFFAPPPP